MNLSDVKYDAEFCSPYRLLDTLKQTSDPDLHHYTMSATVSKFASDPFGTGDLRSIISAEVVARQLLAITLPQPDVSLEWIWTRVAYQVASHGALLTSLRLGNGYRASMKRLRSDYIAAFLDADGCIAQSSGVEIQLRLTNTDLSALTEINNELGAGTIQGPSARSKAQTIKPTKPCYNLVLSRRISRILCAQLIPLLRIKAEQAKICVEYERCETGRSQLPLAEWDKRAALLTRLSTANGHSRVFTGAELQAQQRKFRASRRASAKKSYIPRSN